MLPNRSALAFALLFACPALASAQLRFPQPTANFGALRGGPAYQHRFEFVNDASEPIEILDIRLGCGCLSPVLDKRTIQPGEKGTLVMNLRTLGQANGPRTWQARVHYRQGDKLHEASLTLAATLRHEVTVEPSILAMTVETTLKQEVTIKDHRPTAMNITSVLASSPAIRVSTQSLGDGVTKMTIEVSRADLTAARQEEMLNIYTDDPLYCHLQVPITLTRANRPDVSATPDKVEIVGSGSQLVRLRASSDRAVRIEKIDADHPAIKCVWASGPGNDATLKVSVNAAALTMPNAALVVRVHLAEPSGVIMTIPVQMRKE